MSETRHEAILNQVRTIITDVIEIDPQAIQMSANLREDLHADSLASVEIVMAPEDAFDIQISDEQVAHLRTVGDLVQAITDARRGATADAA